MSAGPATLGYRLSRLLSRHRVTSAAIALAALALLGGTVAATLGLVTARSQAARADSVKAFLADLLTMVNPERRGADVPLSSVLDEASERVAERFAGQPLVEGETRILLGEAYTSLWRVDAAVREYRTAVERFTANAGPEHPETLRARIRLSQGLLGMGKPRDAATASEGLGDLVGRVFGARSREAAQIEIMTARIAASLARPEEAEQRITAAAAWIEVEFADDTDLLLSLMAERVRVTRRVAYHYGLDSPKAMGAFEKAYALSQQLVAFVSERGIPDSTPTFVALGEHTRTAIDIGRYSEALAAADRLLALVEGKLSECHDTRLDALRQRGEALRNMGYGELAVECMLEAMECQRTVVKPGSMAIVSQEIDLLPYLDYTGRFEEVDRQCRAIFVMVERFGPMGEQLAREVKIYEARALSRLGRTDEAEAIFRQLLASADLNAEGRVAARLRAFWAAHLARTGRAEEARAAIAESHRALPATVTGTWQHHVDDRLAVVLETYELLGDTEAAAEARRVQEELFRHNRAEP